MIRLIVILFLLGAPVAAAQPLLPDTLVVINPATNAVSLIATLESAPADSEYLNFTANIEIEGNWVMGDWDGNGLATPAVFAEGGLWYTNQLSGNATWMGVWFGPPEGKPIAGRFLPDMESDCAGLVVEDSVVWWTCDLTVDQPQMRQAWVGDLLADYEGDYQYVAGDWDGDNVDTLAVRRAEVISWTNAPMDAESLTFTGGQYFDPVDQDDYGILVGGDWNVDGLDSFGMVTQGGVFYRRNDLEWDGGEYRVQIIRQPVGTPFQATTWQPTLLLR